MRNTRRQLERALGTDDFGCPSGLGGVKMKQIRRVGTVEGSLVFLGRAIYESGATTTYKAYSLKHGAGVVTIIGSVGAIFSEGGMSQWRGWIGMDMNRRLEVRCPSGRLVWLAGEDGSYHWEEGVEEPRVNSRGEWRRGKSYPVSKYERAVAKVQDLYPLGRISGVEDIVGGWKFYMEVDENNAPIRVRPGNPGIETRHLNGSVWGAALRRSGMRVSCLLR